MTLTVSQMSQKYNLSYTDRYLQKPEILETKVLGRWMCVFFILGWCTRETRMDNFNCNWKQQSAESLDFWESTWKGSTKRKQPIPPVIQKQIL